MLNVTDFLLQLFKFSEVRAETENAEDLPPEPNRGYEWFWPRLLFFNSNSNKCEEEEKYEPPSAEICIEIKDSTIEENNEDEQEQELEQDQEYEDQEEEEEEDVCTCPEVGGFRRKLGCIYRNAKFGLREGALTGVFLGGALGIYKYVDAVYIKGESSEDGGTENSSESTVNDNIIFVTAANGAIAMAVFCTILCCSRGIIYC